MELVFDDLDADVKNYYYTYQLCNADWTPVQVSTFDYIRGFAQNQITEYRYSSVALIRYTHYQISLPENNSRITLSGNYLLKVYMNNDESKIAFTKRFLVVQNAVSISALMSSSDESAVDVYSSKTSVYESIVRLYVFQILFNKLHVVVLQNSRWDNAIYMGNPSFYSGNNFVYNSDDIPLFPGGNQWRWLDLQSFRFQSDRIAHVDYLKNGTVITLKPDKDRSGSAYYYYTDNNGQYYIQTTDDDRSELAGGLCACTVHLYYRLIIFLLKERIFIF